MEQVDTDLGYTWDSYTDPNSVRIGVNWGYTSSQLESQLDPELVIAIAAFLLLVIFTCLLYTSSPRRAHTPPHPLTAHTAAHTPKHGGFSGSMVTMFQIGRAHV